MQMRPVPAGEHATLGDHRRYPGCRVRLSCAMCGWSKSYSAERIIERLRQLRAGGHATRLAQVARRVGWDCPACHRVRWRADLAWPAGMSESEIKRLANRYRN